MVTPRRAHRAAAFAIAALVAILLAGCQPTSEEQAAIDLVNRDRAANGATALATDADLMAKAQGWSQHLADASMGVCSSATLVHSNLADGAPKGWRALGENIACRTMGASLADSVPLLQQQFMNSPGHRANLLNPQFNRVGIGLATVAVAGQPSRRLVFTTQVFARV